MRFSGLCNAMGIFRVVVGDVACNLFGANFGVLNQPVKIFPAEALHQKIPHQIFLAEALHQKYSPGNSLTRITQTSRVTYTDRFGTKYLRNDV